jgi:putative endopeptidase
VYSDPPGFFSSFVHGDFRMKWIKPVFLLLLCAALVTVASAQKKDLSTAPDHFDLNSVDKTLDPCADFYQYACKKWMDANPIPADQPGQSHGAKLQKWNQEVLRDTLEQASANDPKRNAVDQKIGDYYASCMNEEEIDTKGLSAIQAELDKINALKNKSELAAEIAHLHMITSSIAGASNSGFGTAIFGYSSTQDLDDASLVVAQVDQGGLGLPDRDYYFKDDPKSVETRKQYVEHIQKIFTLLGDNPAQAAAHAKTVMDMETALAKGSMDIVKRRDPANLNNKLSQQQLQALTPNFSWDAYLKAVNSPPTHHYLVATPDFLKNADSLINSASLDDWKTYLRWQLANVSSPMLTKAFAEERFDFYGKKLQGQKENQPRWRRCVRAVDRDLGEALGQAYVERTFGADGKARMLQMVNALETALGQDIQQLEWMSPGTRQQALVKLKQIEDKIGYPNKWRDYSSLTIVRGDALGNVYRSSDFEFRRQLDKIGKPVDRGEWQMTPPTVNAYYDPQLNTINFPAGILQPPFFDKKVDDAANYGAIGAVIGHELTHGFDDQGRKFDPQGNLRDWWTEKDGKEFEVRAKCVADEYSGFEATPGTKLNGNLTLGENTADNGGVRIALMALQNTMRAKGEKDTTVDGFSTDQRFFLAFGQVWCANTTPENLRLRAQSDPHSTPKWRVNGVVSNMPEFQKAFNCKQGQAMVRENACHVW